MDQHFNQVLSKRELVLFFRKICKPGEDTIKFADFVELLSSSEPSEENKRLIKKRLKFTAK